MNMNNKNWMKKEGKDNQTWSIIPPHMFISTYFPVCFRARFRLGEAKKGVRHKIKQFLKLFRRHIIWYNRPGPNNLYKQKLTSQTDRTLH